MIRTFYLLALCCTVNAICLAQNIAGTTIQPSSGPNAEIAARTRFINGADLQELLQRKEKPYCWVAMWIPKCPVADTSFATYMRLREKYKDRVHFILVPVVNNPDSFQKFAAKYHYTDSFYVISTAYGAVMQRHLALMKDFNERAHLSQKQFNQLLADNNGRVLYRKFITQHFKGNFLRRYTR